MVHRHHRNESKSKLKIYKQFNSTQKENIMTISAKKLKWKKIIFYLTVFPVSRSYILHSSRTKHRRILFAFVWFWTQEYFWKVRKRHSNNNNVSNENRLTPITSNSKVIIIYAHKKHSLILKFLNQPGFVPGNVDTERQRANTLTTPPPLQ